VKTSSVEEGSRVLGVLGDVAGDALQIRAFNLFVADTESLRANARRRAVEDALERARQIADAAGVRLGEVLSLEEEGVPEHGRPMRGFVTAAAAGGPPVEPGSLSVDVRVVLTAEIAD